MHRIPVVLAVILLSLIPAAARADVPPQFVLMWGSQGSQPGQFSFPLGIGTDATGFVVVADRENRRVQRFLPTGAFLDEFGSPGGIRRPGARSVQPVQRNHDR